MAKETELIYSLENKGQKSSLTTILEKTYLPLDIEKDWLTSNKDLTKTLTDLDSLLNVQGEDGDHSYRKIVIYKYTSKKPVVIDNDTSGPPQTGYYQ